MRRATLRTAVASVLLALLPAVAAAQEGLGVSEDQLEELGLTQEELFELVLISLAIFLVLAALIAVLLFQFRRAFVRSADAHVRREPIKSGLVGLGVVIGVFLLSIVVDTVVFAVFPPLSALIVLSFSVFVVAAYVLGSVMIGHVVLRQVRDETTDTVTPMTLWSRFLVGFVIALVLWFVPIVNLLSSLVVVSVGVGGLVQHVRKGRIDPDAPADDDRPPADPALDEEW